MKHHEESGARLPNVSEPLRKVGVFGRGMWRYWRFGQPEPDSNFVVQKLYAFTDGRSNDFLFRLLESRRRETDFKLGWDATSLISDAGVADPTIDEVVRTLKEDGVVVLPRRLKQETIQNLYQLASTCELKTSIYGPPKPPAPGHQPELYVVESGTTQGLDPAHPRASNYGIARELLLENSNIQRLLCDPYLLAIATGYLGVFPVVTKPEMWWDTDQLPQGLRPRPFHTDSGCLRWFKVGINLTETTLETPHFVYVKGSHHPNKDTRPLTRRLVGRMNLTHKEVMDVCSDKVVHVTAPAGSITLADTRGIHKGELASRGHRLILYFGLEGSAFNNIDRPSEVRNIGSELEQAMRARPFGYQFFRIVH